MGIVFQAMHLYILLTFLMLLHFPLFLPLLFSPLSLSLPQSSPDIVILVSS